MSAALGLFLTLGLAALRRFPLRVGRLRGLLRGEGVGTLPSLHSREHLHNLCSRSGLAGLLVLIIVPPINEELLDVGDGQVIDGGVREDEGDESFPFRWNNVEKHHPLKSLRDPDTNAIETRVDTLKIIYLGSRVAGGVDLEVHGNFELLVGVGEGGSGILLLEVVPNVISAVQAGTHVCKSRGEAEHEGANGSVILEPV